MEVPGNRRINSTVTAASLAENRQGDKEDFLVITFTYEILSKPFRPYNIMLVIDLASLPSKTFKWTYLRPE